MQILKNFREKYVSNLNGNSTKLLTELIEKHVYGEVNLREKNLEGIKK